MNQLDLDFIRNQFPALEGEWTFFDNAGGSQTARQVGDRIQDYLYSTNVQLGASYSISQQAGERVMEAQTVMANLINAPEPAEVILGSSTTQLLQNLSKSLVQTFKQGDEVIVTNCDHEANIGPWINMQKAGVIIKTWKVNPETLELHLEDLNKLMTEKTRLVAFTHVSNVLGTINPVKEFTSFIHNKGALVCVDGVAYAPHRLIDVQKWNIDFYAFSFYKVYGPHYSLLYVNKKTLDKLPGINHFFIGNEEGAYKLQPGNVNYELSYGLLGVIDYFEAVNKHLQIKSNDFEEMFKLFALHEEKLASLLINFLKSKSNVKIYGHSSSDHKKRVPTISFTMKDKKSSAIPIQIDKYHIGIRYGDFYARRLIEDLGLLDNDGIIRVSMVHYNTQEEVENLIDKLEPLLS